MSSSADDLRQRVERLSPNKRALLSQRLGDMSDDAAAPAGGDATLVAYVAPRGDHPPEAAELRDFLREYLPPYMVPSTFVVLDALPRTANGKVDRRTLPAPGAAGRELNTSFVAPRTADEQALAALWDEVLGFDRIGVHDNFWEIGGHSLLAVQLLGRIREAFEANVPMEALLETPSIAALAAHFETLRWAARDDAEPPHDEENEREEFRL